MKEEIEAAARFLTLLVSRSNQTPAISEEHLQTFKRHLVRLFEERFHVSGLCFNSLPVTSDVNHLHNRITGFLRGHSEARHFDAFDSMEGAALTL